MRKILAVVVFAVMLAIFFAGEIFTFSKPVNFRTFEVKIGDIKDIIPAVGKVRAANAIDVGSEISGRVVEVFYDHNDQIKKGDLLAQIDPAPFEATLAHKKANQVRTEAALTSAIAARDGTKLKLQRATLLSNKGAGQTSLVEDLEIQLRAHNANVDTAKANVDIARASVLEAEVDLAKTEIFAPISGFVLDRRIDPGQIVNASQTTPILFRLSASLIQITVEAQVYENDILRIQQGMRARLSVPGGNDFIEGVARKILKRPNQTGKLVTYTVLVDAIDPEERLFPGMTASVDFIHQESIQTKIVPIRALYFEPSNYQPGENVMSLLKEVAPDLDTMPEARRHGLMFGAEMGLLLKKGKRRLFVLNEQGGLSRIEATIGAQTTDYVEITDDSVSVGQLVVVGESSDRVAKQ